MQSLSAREIEIGFVNRNHFHDRRKFCKDGCDAVAPLPVFFVMTVKKNCVRAEFSRGAQGHRRMNPEFPSLVARGRNDAALIGAAADNNRLAAKLRPIEEFYR